MPETEKYKLVIIGGGISGLLCGHFAQKKESSFCILESGPDLGGWVDTRQEQGFLFEWGPHSLHADSSWLSLLDDLRLEAQRMKESTHDRFIFRRKRPEALPLNPLTFLWGRFFSWKEKIRILRGAFRRMEIKSDLSVFDFFKKLLGQSFAEDVISAFIHGVYAGDAKKLSASACFPDLFDHIQSGRPLVSFLFKKRESKKTVSFPKGLVALIKALRSSIDAKIFSDCRVESIQREGEKFVLEAGPRKIECEKVIFCVPAFEVARLGRQLLTEPALIFLSGIFYIQTAVWNCLWRRPRGFRPGYGCLVPPGQNQRLLGSLWPSEMFSGRCEPGQLITAQFFSGDNVPKDPLEELPFVQKVLRTKERPLHSEYRVHEKAIPQLGLKHRDNIKSLRASLPPQIALSGNYLSGVGLSSCLYEAKQAVTKLYGS